MRVLLAHHLPLNSGRAGVYAARLVGQLHEAGHETRLLVVGRDATDADDQREQRRVVCQPGNGTADLPFELPDFAAGPTTSLAFRDLTDEQLNAYREALRRAFDAEIDAFDPQVVHAQHVWLLAHLALEAGVPYAVSAYDDELSGYAGDRRFGRLMQEAAENAGRVLVHDAALLAKVEVTFGDLEGRAELAPTTGREIADVYFAILDERFGL